MRVFSIPTRITIALVYYLIHRNLIFGYIYKNLFENFYYKDLVFSLKSVRLPISNYSSFFFKTYEFNDRVLIEKYINNRNSCIIIGGGIGFIAALCFLKSKKKILVFCFRLFKVCEAEQKLFFFFLNQSRSELHI